MRQSLMGKAGLAAVLLMLSACGGGEEDLQQTPGAPSGITTLRLPAMPLFAPAAVPSPSPSPSPSPAASPTPAASPSPSPAPSASPTPAPSPTPSPAPTPTPTPAPTPTPSPSPTPSGACNLPAHSDGTPCFEEHPHFNNDAEAAVRQIRKDQPNLFESDGKVVKPQFYDDYVQGVAEILRSYGYCAAQGGPEDEVAVKTTNDWNDQYDVLKGDGESWVAYTVTCRPSRF
jgi:hypothetical protein